MYKNIMINLNRLNKELKSVNDILVNFDAETKNVTVCKNNLLIHITPNIGYPFGNITLETFVVKRIEMIARFAYYILENYMNFIPEISDKIITHCIDSISKTEILPYKKRCSETETSENTIRSYSISTMRADRYL